LLAEAGIQPVWSGPPTAEAIHKLDQERLLQDPHLTDDGSEEDLATARALLAGRSAEEIATALVRLYRSRLPAAEEVYDPGPHRPSREPRGLREGRGVSRDRDAPAEGAGPRVWFRLDIGRQNNADPRWLLPMICRRGKITKADIGAIRIFERETKFEVAQAAAERFAASVRRSPDEEARIEPLAQDFHRGRGKLPGKTAWKPKPGSRPERKQRRSG
jgi:ATP-dependent RNA helicase DeaD